MDGHCWLAPLFISRFQRKAVYGLSFLVLYPIIAYFLLHGGIFGLTNVATSQWGGLMLTLVIATVGIAGALPLGIMLALGRRSNMPAIRVVCVTFIEFWRGVPLITVLFMSSVMLPLFLPEGMGIDKLLRALIGGGAVAGQTLDRAQMVAFFNPPGRTWLAPGRCPSLAGAGLHGP